MNAILSTADAQLCEQARLMGRHASTAETIHRALELYLSHLKRQDILSEFGHVDFDPDYDYKEQRARQ